MSPVSESALFDSIKPVFTSASTTEPAEVQKVISALQMQKHPEGGYFVETDRDPLRVPNPFPDAAKDDSTRSASTSIFYYLTPTTSFGSFHRNKARTVHTLHEGRGQYVIIHADEARPGQPARVETFLVGHDIAKGERLQWVVEGGKYKSSFLLPDTADGTTSGKGLLISETVVPGFEFTDHDFLKQSRFLDLVPASKTDRLQWLVRQEAEA